MNNELKSFIDKIIKTHTDKNKITVLPLQCGLGKSEYVKTIIADCISNDKGLIVVTDVIERLNSYTTALNDLGEYIRRNRDKLAILTASTISEEQKTLFQKNIVLMTTQRYFNLSLDEIRALTKNRPLIIFDEKPFMFEVMEITLKSLYDVELALTNGLDDTVNQAEKQFLIEQWRYLTEKLQKDFKTNEDLNKEYKREIFYKLDDNIFNKSKFLKLVDKYKRQINKYNYNALKIIQAVNQLSKEGIITSQKVKVKNSDNQYKNYFTVVLNNLPKLTDTGAKVFVLDGTADISPEYKLKRVDMVDCKHFKRTLDTLTINIVDVNTGITTLNKRANNDVLNTLISYIKIQPEQINTVFTYKDIADEFKNDFSINWFGKIKGSNAYREETNIAQIGVNRFPDLVYSLLANEIGQVNDYNNDLINRIYDEITMDKIRSSYLLSDLEQNIFRSAIRNYDRTKRCVYFLFLGVNQYPVLIDLIKNRYETAGATVNIINTPSEIRLLKIKKRNTKKQTNAQKILDWLSSKEKGYQFKISELKKDLSISDNAFDKVKKETPEVKNIFEKLKTDKKGYYKI